MNSELKIRSWNLKKKYEISRENLNNFQFQWLNFTIYKQSSLKKMQNFNIFIPWILFFFDPSPLRLINPSIFSIRSFIIPWALYTKLVQNFLFNISAARFEWIKTRKAYERREWSIKHTKLQHRGGGGKMCRGWNLCETRSIVINWKNLSRLVSSCEWNVNLYFFSFHHHSKLAAENV